MRYRITIVIAAAWLTPFSVSAACIFGGGFAGQSAPYHYAVSYINSISAAETGLKRISTVARRLTPTNDYATALAGFTEALKEYELAARDFECAASIIRPQEKFAPAGSKLDQDQTELARKIAALAQLLYLQLAEETRGIASLLVEKMNGAMSDVEFAERMAKVSANLHDIPRQVFSTSPGVPHVLVDPKPDATNRISRLSITRKERDDLIDMLDKAFGKRVAIQVKGDRPAIEATAALLRNWLATSGHTPLPSKGESR